VLPEPIYTAIIFVALLGVLVYFHELGHFAMAKLLGMKVTEFAFGFGPKLVTLGRRRETEYTIRAVPLGGFVRLPGMDPTIESPEELREREGIEPEEAFNARPIRHRAAVIVAGPLASLLLGYIVFIIIGMTIGWPTGNPLPQVGQVQPGTPAEQIGLQTGDVIREIDGIRITSGKQAVDYIHAHPGKWVTLVIERDGKLLTRGTKTMAVPRNGKKEGRLGFIAASAVKREGVLRSVERGTVETAKLIYGLFTTVFSREVAKNVGGIVAIARITSETVKLGPFWVLLQLAALSLTVAFMNLVPWPILDGGHLLFLAIERIRGKRLAPQVQLWITQVGLTVLVVLALLLVYRDTIMWISRTPLQ